MVRPNPWSLRRPRGRHSGVTAGRQTGVNVGVTALPSEP
jgi:hypothetical protein